MLTYEDLLRLSDDVQITYEYQPVKYQPQRLWRWAEIAKEETLNASL